MVSEQVKIISKIFSIFVLILDNIEFEWKKVTFYSTFEKVFIDWKRLHKGNDKLNPKLEKQDSICKIVSLE